MKLNQKGNTNTILIIILVLLLMGAGVYFVGTITKRFGPGPTEKPSVEKAADTEQQPSSTPTSEQTASPTADWKTYRNEKYGFEVKYPSNWKEKQSALMSNFGNLAHFWAESGSGKGFIVEVWNTSTYSYSDLSQPPPGGIDPGTIKKENITVAGYPAVKFSYTSVGDASSGASLTQKVSTLKNGLVYIIECGEPKCAQILSTFRFIK